MNKIKYFIFILFCTLCLSVITSPSALSQAVTLLQPANNSQCLALNVQFQWTSAPEVTFYTLQASTDNTFTTFVFVGATLTSNNYSYTMPNHNTTYYWRVISTFNTYNDTSLVFSFKTGNVPPLSIAPANNSTGNSIQPLLIWTVAVKADSFGLQIATDNNFTNVVTDLNNIDTTHYSVTGGLNYNTVYYWRVRGYYGSCISDWSNVLSFTTDYMAPVLVSPADSSNCILLKSTLTWNPVNPATAYRIQVSDLSNFTNLIINLPNNTGTSDNIVLDTPLKRYYWRVRAEDANNSGEWSVSRTFVTTISSPLPASPANYTSSLPKDSLIQIHWTMIPPDTNPLRFAVQVSTEPGFSTGILLDTTDINGNYCLFTTRAYSVIYYWRIRATHLNCLSDWSSTWQFRTLYDKPVLITPNDNATCILLNDQYTWNPVQLASKYRLQISTSANFNSLVVDQSKISGTSVNALLTQPYTNHYWRVRAEDSLNTGLWSDTRTLKTTVGSPTLVTPINKKNSLMKDSIVALTWNMVPPDNNPLTFDLQVATDQTFNSGILLDTLIVNALTANFTPTQFGTPYYWRLRTNHLLCTSDWTATWMFKTQYDQPMQLTPADSAIYILLKPVLTWTGIPGALAYRLQVSDTASFSRLVVNVPNITATTYTPTLPKQLTWYYWRVRAEDTTNTGLWSGVFKFRTTISSPILLSPANLSNGIKLSTNFVWKVTTPADSFNLQLSTSNTFSNNLIDVWVPHVTGIDTLSYAFTLPTLNTTYYWRVKTAANDNSNYFESDWANTWQFTTAYPQAVLVSPPDMASCQPITAKYIWHKVAGATKYRIQISDYPGFDSLRIDASAVADTFYTATVPYGMKTFYWRVRGENAVNIGLWSNVRSFTATVGKPALSTPANNTTGYHLNMTFDWNGIDNIARHHLEVSTSADFSQLVVNDSNIVGGTATRLLPSYTTIYYWRVKTSYNGCISDWSDVWSFETSLEAPILTFPANNAQNQPLTVLFQWTPPFGATSFEFNIATDRNFNNIFYGEVGIATSHISITNLDGLTTYYWRVNASDSTGTSPWSNVFVFNTTIKGPDIPVLVFPEYAATKVPIDTPLRWLKTARVNKYQLQVSTDADFNNLIIDQNNLTDTSYNRSQFANYTVYYWHVRAQNDSGLSSWSITWNFRTVALQPTDKALLLSPVNQITNTGTALMFTWNIVNLATFYEMQVSTSTDFSTPNLVVNNTYIPGPGITLDLFNYDTQYYWHVNGGNESGNGPWSDVWSFKTMPNTSVTDEFEKDLNLSIIPNPFETQAEVCFTLSSSQDVSIRVYNLLAEEMFTYPVMSLNAGSHNIKLDGSILKAGTYFCAVRIGSHKYMRQFIISK